MTPYTSSPSTKNASFLKDGSLSYILKTGKEAAQALEAQHEYLAESSYQLVDKAGLRAGHTVWEIGCGSGTMTEYFAKVVKATGHVFAVDISAAQLEIAKARLKEAGLTNVTLNKGDIQSWTDFSRPPADLIYTRFVLMHLTDPKEALNNMRSLLKNDGVVALQESIWHTCRLSIENEAYNHYVDTMIELGKRRGVDFNIGEKLPTYCKDSLFRHVDFYHREHVSSPQQIELIFINRLYEWGPEAVRENLITAEEIEQWKQSIRKTLKDNSTSCVLRSTLAYVLAWK